MSNPENPLSHYYTYSYHHILIACDTTATAEELSVTNETRMFARHSNYGRADHDPSYKKSSINSKYNPLYTPAGGKYVIIIDGMSDSDFILHELSWLTSTAANIYKSGYYNAIVSEGSFSVSEPRGIRFLNILEDVCDTLNSDSLGLVWMIKTIFIGHVQRGTDAYISHIPPLLFTMYDVKVNFSVIGGEYKISFASINNGASKLPQTSRVVEGISIDLTTTQTQQGGKTLKHVFAQLESLINAKYMEYYTRVINKLKDEKITPNFKKVVYEIDVNVPYDGKEYIVDSANGPQSGSLQNDGIIHFGETPTIESAIDEIMLRCTRVREDAQGANNTTQYVYKVFSAVVTSQDEYRISYRVRRFPQVKNNIISAAQNLTDAKLIRDNLVVFDYIFTGQNLDIENMDMNLDMGLAFFQALTTTDSIMDQTTTITKVRPDKKTVPANDISLKGLKFRGAPLFPDTTVKCGRGRNTGDPGTLARYNATLQRYAGLEGHDATLEITGNPNLLASYCQLPSVILSDPILRVRTTETDKVKPTDTKSYDTVPADKSGYVPLFPDSDHFPALCKINIRMPTSPDTLYGHLEPFWYQGFYYIHDVEHHFKDGKFTQTLRMVSLPSDLTENITVQDIDLYEWSKNEGTGEKTAAETQPYKPSAEALKAWQVCPIGNVKKKKN